MVRPACRVCCPFLGLGRWLLALWAPSEAACPLGRGVPSCAERWLCSISAELQFPRSWFLGPASLPFLLPGFSFQWWTEFIGSKGITFKTLLPCQFWTGNKRNQFLHLCEWAAGVTDVPRRVSPRKLAEKLMAFLVVNPFFLWG